MLPVLQLNMDQRKSIDQQRHIKPPVAAGAFCIPCRRVLVDHLIDRRSTRLISTVQRHKMQHPIVPLHMHHRLAILPCNPDSCIIEGRK